jgi:ribonuclease VapC
MIVLDTSAIIAIVSNEPRGQECADVMYAETEILISAGTLTELLILATRQNLLPGVRQLLALSVSQIVEVTSERAGMAAAAYAKWGKGFHRAGLNFGDCFAYATAKEFDCPLLYIGNDFAQTDVRSALPPSSS